MCSSACPPFRVCRWKVWSKMKKCLLAALTLLSALSAGARVQLTPLFTDNLVLQQEAQVPVWADATIDGDSVVVSSPDVPHPLAVRYAWGANPVCNLFNSEGLPAWPFRTDDWPGLTYGKL